MLQTHVQSMVDKDVKLVNVVQVMLVRLVLPCQHRACNMWEYDLAEHQTLRELYGSSHKDIWKVLFKSGKPWPGSTKDCGYQLSRSASPVSYCCAMSICVLAGISRGRRTYHAFYNNPRKGRKRWSGYTAQPHCRRNWPDLF